MIHQAVQKKLLKRRIPHRSYSQKRLDCPICQFDCSINNMGKHIKSKHPDVWEKWRTYHLEWNSEVSFNQWLQTTFKKREKYKVVIL